MNRSGVFSGIVARAAYPGVLITSVAFAAVLLDHGVSPSLATPMVFVATLLLTGALERAWPHERAWNPPGRETVQDWLYLALAGATQAAARVLGQLLALVVAIALVRWLGPRPWPRGWPLWAQAALGLALADLGKYWLHRLAHERPWLWRFHAAHHAPIRMYSLNGVRLHPVNMLWNLVLDAGIPLALGLEGRAVALVAVFRGTVSVLQHANVEMRLGGLNWILSTPELHQWHHSAALDEAHANYGSTFIVWDILFGTRRLPRDRRAPESLGLAEGGVHPRRFWHQLIGPWCHPQRGAEPRAAG